MADFVLTPTARRSLDSLTNISTASQFQLTCADNLYIAAKRPYVLMVTGLSGKTTSLLKADIYRPLSTDTGQPYSGMVQTSGYAVGVTTQSPKVLVTSTLPKSTQVVIPMGPISGKFAYFPASSDKTAGDLYHKIVLYGSDVHLHVLFSTEPTVYAQYIG
jgi:hypothetical protein